MTGQIGLMQMSSSLLFPSISPQNLAIFEASESLRSFNSVCFTGFKHGIRGFGLRNLDKSRAFMSISVGSQTAANDAFFSDYKPTSAFLFPGQGAQAVGMGVEVQNVPASSDLYNKIGAQSAQMKMTPVGRAFSWESYNDETTSYEDKSFTTVGLLEQINTTKDVSDYLWYMTDVRIDSDEALLRGGKWPVLTVLSAGQALHVFINSQITGNVYRSIKNPKITLGRGVYKSGG